MAFPGDNSVQGDIGLKSINCTHCTLNFLKSEVESSDDEVWVPSPMPVPEPRPSHLPGESHFHPHAPVTNLFAITYLEKLSLDSAAPARYHTFPLLWYLVKVL